MVDSDFRKLLCEKQVRIDGFHREVHYLPRRRLGYYNIFIININRMTHEEFIETIRSGVRKAVTATLFVCFSLFLLSIFIAFVLLVINIIPYFISI